MDSAAMKTCPVCGETKPREQFYTKSARCKPCCGEYQRQYYAERRDKIAERMRHYTAENRDKITERKRQHYAENRDKIAERRRQHYAENWGKIAEYHRQYYVAYSLTRGTTLTRADIPPALLEAKRLQLKLKRLTREAT